MTFSVLWKARAEEQLAAVWMAARDRDAVASAANRIDSLLRSDPSSRGESRAGAIRILIVPPLAVTFEVNEADRTVLVLDLRPLPRRA